MTNPLELPKPETTIRQVQDYARDLAYLVTEESLDPKFVQKGATWFGPHSEGFQTDNINYRSFRKKWGKINDELFSPSRKLNLLASFGFVLHTPSDALPDKSGLPTNVYILSSKAFELLNRPVVPPTIFISYRRIQSSAFALLIEARLLLAGAEHPIIDKNIPNGEDWAVWLKARVMQADIFICLIGPKTLSDPNGWVEKEIEWATEKGARIISIWHGTHRKGVYKSKDAGQKCPEILRRMQNINVLSEDAKGYETAINELLNSLEYPTVYERSELDRA